MPIHIEVWMNKKGIGTQMLKIKSYVKVKSIAEAYELNQKKTALVLGGMVWLKMGNRNISTAIFPAWGWIQCRKQMMSL